MENESLKYINAINVIIEAKIGEFLRLQERFAGNWIDALHAVQKEYGIEVDSDREWSKLHENNIEIITIYDRDYPRLLKQIHDPPFVLYMRGDRSAFDGESLAVVGTRKVTAYGKQITGDLVGPLARAGLTIYSGLALGIDALAHKAALDAHGTTVAVMANGLDDFSLQPRSNRALAREIIQGRGLFVSEYALGYQAHPYSFPQRNRILSGLTKGVLVIECDLKSGTMITARSALDQNRSVFAVPGSIYSKRSEGTHWLIKQGATLVSSPLDVLQEYDIKLQVPNNKSQVTAATPEELKILACLSDGARSVDDVVTDTGLDIAIVNATLIIMELEKKVTQLQDGNYVSGADICGRIL